MRPRGRAARRCLLARLVGSVDWLLRLHPVSQGVGGVTSSGVPSLAACGQCVVRSLVRPCRPPVARGFCGRAFPCLLAPLRHAPWAAAGPPPRRDLCVRVARGPPRAFRGGRSAAPWLFLAAAAAVRARPPRATGRAAPLPGAKATRARRASCLVRCVLGASACWARCVVLPTPCRVRFSSGRSVPAAAPAEADLPPARPPAVPCAFRRPCLFPPVAARQRRRRRRSATCARVQRRRGPPREGRSRPPPPATTPFLTMFASRAAPRGVSRGVVFSEVFDPPPASVVVVVARGRGRERGWAACAARRGGAPRLLFAPLCGCGVAGGRARYRGAHKVWRGRPPRAASAGRAVPAGVVFVVPGCFCPAFGLVSFPAARGTPRTHAHAHAVVV